MAVCILLLGGAVSAGCNKAQQTNMSALDAAGIPPEVIDQLKGLQVTEVEVQQLVLAHQAGMSDEGCIEMVRIAHSHHQPFSSAEAVTGLMNSGMKESSVLEMARLNLVPMWAGEAQAMRLAGVPESMIMIVARRRAAGQPTISGDRIVKLRNTGMPDSQIIAEIQKGTTDAQADRMIAYHEALMTTHGFVRQSGRRK